VGLLLLGALGCFGCASTSPISGHHYADLAVRPDDITYIIARQHDNLRYGKYFLVEHFPNPAAISAGMPSRVAFERLGKATGIEVNLASFPPAEVAMKAEQDIAIEWRTTAYWSLARRHSDERIETANITVSFVKLTRTKADIQYVGSPLFRALDQGWFIEQVNVFPLLHNLKAASKRR